MVSDSKRILAIAAVLLLAAMMGYLALVAPDAEGRDHAVSGETSHLGTMGSYSTEDFDPQAYLESWNFNDLPPSEREKFYRETELADGSLLREYWFYVRDERIEVAPGVFFDAWTYNGQVPAPTIRATEGDTMRIYFMNHGSKSHTMHFHGFHQADVDGAMAEQFVGPGENFTL